MSPPQIRGWLPFAAAAIALAAGLVLAGLALLGGSAPERADAAVARPALRPVGSCDRLRSYLARHSRALRVSGAGSFPGGVVADGVAAPSAAEAAPPSGSATNLQEPGVDEPDIVKASGSVIFTVDGDRLRAVNTGAGAPAIADSLRLPRGPGKTAPVGDYRLLVAGDRLLAIGSSYEYASYEGDVGVVAPDLAYPGTPRSVLAEIDVSDPGALRVMRTMTLDGSYVSARLTGSTVRLVSSDYPSPVVADHGHGRAVLPRVTVHDRVAGERRRGSLGTCSDVSRPSRFAGGELLSVLTIDLARGLPPVDVDSVLSGGEIVYASPTSLYVATERWNVGSDPSGSQVSTQIHRFDTSGPDSTSYVASGRVSGSMLSQWSMSEQDGILRVASTTAPPWSPDGSDPGRSQSFVTELATDGDRLRDVGRVGDLGRGEDIYAVRFVGDLGYVVTFRQVDPLYVLDLSDPTAPRDVGQLKIPGYSAYLHPVGQGLLLGIGRRVDPGGVPGGVQASLFEVSDPTAPVRLDRERFGGASNTEVETDHHAFSWLDGAALALLPLDSYRSDGTEAHFLAGLRVSPGGADPLGRVAKPVAGEGVRRTLELGGRVYAVRGDGISVYEPATLHRIASLAY